MVEGNDRVILLTDENTPTASSEGEKGEMRFDATNLYFCIDDNDWKKIPWQNI
jgi:hypothetical protein